MLVKENKMRETEKKQNKKNNTISFLIKIFLLKLK